jgi:hypothetical protein
LNQSLYVGSKNACCTIGNHTLGYPPDREFSLVAQIVVAYNPMKPIFVKELDLRTHGAEAVRIDTPLQQLSHQVKVENIS